MPVTLTVKQVPDRLARRLRERASANRRSLQGELMTLLEQALAGGTAAREPDPGAYAPKRRSTSRRPSVDVPAHGPKLPLAEIWKLAKRIEPSSPGESTQIVRKMRDERYGR